MKTPSLLGIITMLAAPLAATAQINTVFSDNFSGSTLNPTATSPGTLTSTRTAYEIASSKAATASTIAAGVMSYGNFSTSSGYCEGQALFTASPVTLNTPGQYLELYYTFTDTVTLFNGNANDNEQVSLGLYNSGGVGPTNGTGLWNSGLSSSLTAADVGCTKGWIGYCGEIAYSKANAEPSDIATRPAQTGANNDNQGLCPVSGYSSGVNIAQLNGVLGQPLLTVGNQYTLDLKIYYVNATTLAITNALYVGAGNGGPVYASGSYTAQNGTTVTGANLLTTTFDSMCLAFRPTSSPTSGETNRINNVTVLNVYPIAPAITGLTNQTVIAGNSTTLSPTVTGVPAPAFQWWVSTDGGATSNSIAGATNATLTLSNVQYSQNNYQYTLAAINSLGTAASNMTLTVIVPPAITGLANQAGTVGSTITISPTVSGVPAPTEQWQTNGVNLADGTDANGSTISGSTTSTLTIANAQAADSVTYSLIASNSAGMVTNSMALTVSSGNVAPAITGPTNLTVIQGGNATFTASVSGVPVPAEQWLDQTGTPIPGATNLSLTLSSVQYSQNGYVYSLVASNSVNSVTNSATLTVLVPPAISSQPVSLVITNTQSASFSVTAAGVPSPAYQWYKTNAPISSAVNPTATNATLTIASASATDMATNYYVMISNAAGTTNSVNVSLTVNSTMGTTAFSPANGATGLCYDTPISITFNQAPSVGAAGTIKIYNINNPSTPVDTINVALGAVQQRTFPGDGQSFSYQVIQISGDTATIIPDFNVLTSNATYFVTIDDGAFTDPTGALFTGISGTSAWQFSTKAGGPANPANPVVNANGSADFLTVQGAVNSIPSGNTNPAIISINNGAYREIVDVSGKNNLIFRGQSRLGTLVGFPNNATFQAANGGSTHCRMAFKVNANNISLDNLTVTNMTPQGGSQAEALMIETSAQRCIVNNCDIVSLQDTILANVNSSQAYFYNSAVRGNYDYIWGGGNLYFNQCVLDTVAGENGANLTAARTTTNPTQTTNYPWANPGATYTANGMTFVNCAFTADPGAGTVTLADGNGSAGELVSWYNCTFATNYIAPASTLFSGNFIFWQDLNTVSNNPVTYANVTSISGSDARLLAATNIPVWFYGWVPQLAPNILANPAGQSVSGGATATFTVTATGIGTPTYQWLFNGSPLSGQTGASLTINSANANNAGSYSVIVSNSAGVVTSSVAALAVGNTAPTFAPVSNQTVNVGANVSVANVATDPDVPAQTLSYSLLTGPAGSAVDGSGNFTWRPAVSFAGTSNIVQVVVTDNGTPNLSATNSFSVIVNPLAAPSVTATTYAGGVFSVTISGQNGPDYELQSTTNLSGGTWVDVVTASSPASPFTLTDTNAATQPVQFYRIVTGPPLP